MQLDYGRVKWGYATRAFSAGLPELMWENRLGELEGAPAQDDVIVAEVMHIEQHTRIELPTARSSALFEGDLVGVAYGHRYATRQFYADIPDSFDVCHLLSVAGVCGRVVSSAGLTMKEPTILRPLGFALDRDGRRVNLRRVGLAPANPTTNSPTSVLVVGSSMDAGKTTTAASIVHGLTRSGFRVGAAKLTGTGSAKDLMYMKDAGAAVALDFTDVGHASTSQTSRHDLANIHNAIRSNLSAASVDYVVMEIADGIVQRETQMLLDILKVQKSVDFVVYCCCDSLGVEAGVNLLQSEGFEVAAVAGLAACSPLAAQEARGLTRLPVLQSVELRDPGLVRTLLPMRQRTPALTVVS